ncbi:RE1-silencing transcription factor-like [Cylas formicarius]|uniref:RE1-silencing transcription factor-like n=1 Tax=Cylas formicarius TaxID=197179 RepID=UPI002958B069|nr:RE1-silencing transcription factor-like [Cylas formicarius]
MGKKCCVPFCHTGYTKYNEKHPMYGVPKNDFFLDKWQEAIARADRPITPNDCVCQKHFKADDFIHSRVVKGEIEQYKVPKLRPDAVPSIFPDFPEAIHGTVRKRRKLPAELDTEPKIGDTERVYVKIKLERGEEGTNLEEQSKNNSSSRYLVSNVEDIKQEVLIKSEDGNMQEEHCSEQINNISREEEVSDSGDTGVGTFKCNHCNYRSKWLHNVQTHQTKHLEGEEHYFRCKFCPDFKSKWRNTYKNHMKIKHSVGKYHPEYLQCPHCDYQTKTKINFGRHMKQHELKTMSEKFQCEKFECEFSTNSKSLYTFHMKTHKEYIQQNKSIQCKECLFEADSKKKLKIHGNTMHGNSGGVLDLSSNAGVNMI